VNKKVYGIAKKYVTCVIFSLDLFILVIFSEMIRSTIMSFASSGSLFSISISLLLVIVLIPAFLLITWLYNPIAVKRLLWTFGLTERSLNKKRETEDKEGKT